MASSISNSSSSSNFGDAFRRLFEATSAMEDWASTVSDASTRFYSLGGSSVSALSQVTVNSERSQFTVQGSVRSAVLSAKEKQQDNKKGTNTTPPSYGGLEKDQEGEETRKEMLARRRKECQVEEVDVALAPVMKIKTPFCFYPDQYKRFRQLFPRVNPDPGLSFTHHDHPVAHTSNMVGIRRMQGAFKHGSKVLDLHGNPNGNELYNRFQLSRVNKRPGLPQPPVVHTLVEMMTASDAVRKVTKWGDEFDNLGARRYVEMSMDDIEPDKYDTFSSVHTLYYYTMYQVNSLLSRNRKAKLYAIVNYSKENSGTLYGELRFTKEGGMTTQVSPNGEKYRHPDIDSWFQASSFRGLTETLGCGISWTSTCIGGPLYMLTITSCDWSLARPHRYEPPSTPTLKVSSGRSFFGLVKVGGSNVKLNITNGDLAAELRHFMVFRDRNNPQTFLDLCVKARRCTGSDLVDGSRVHRVGDGELQDHIAYAYLVDAPGELEIMEGIKLLRGDLLAPLAESLKLQGKDNKDSLFQAFIASWTVGRKKPTQALGNRSLGNNVSKPNTGGLLPTHRT